MKTISREEIRRELAIHYDGGTGFSVKHRTLVEYDHDEGTTLGEGSVIFLFLSGTPPKGYAIVIPEHRTINLYDAWGKRFRIINDAKLGG